MFNLNLKTYKEKLVGVGDSLILSGGDINNINVRVNIGPEWADWDRYEISYRMNNGPVVDLAATIDTEGTENFAEAVIPASSLESGILKISLKAIAELGGVVVSRMTSTVYEHIVDDEIYDGDVPTDPEGIVDVIVNTLSSKRGNISELVFGSGFTVSVVNDKVQIDGGGASSIFYAIYGTTSLSDVINAFNNHKIVFTIYQNKVYYASQKASDNSFVYFTLIWESASNVTYDLVRVNSSGWTVLLTRQLEKINNKVTSISPASTNDQYPSAKAVYDYVQGHTGLPVISYENASLMTYGEANTFLRSGGIITRFISSAFTILHYADQDAGSGGLKWRTLDNAHTITCSVLGVWSYT